jgi:hypothetical protein
MGTSNEFIDAAEVQTRGPVEALSVRIEKLLVGLYDTYDLDVRAMKSSAGGDKRTALEEPRNVAMHKTDDADAQGSRR